MVFWKALCIAVIIAAAFCPAPSFGADAKALLSEANTLFRNADKDFMSGKMDSAWETVQKAKEAISAAREADPSNSQVASLEKRIDQLAEKIEKRLAAKPQSSPSGQPASGSGAPKRLPATASRYLMEADRALKRAEDLLGPDRDKQDPGRLPARVREALDPAEKNMGRLLEEFPDFNDHPDVTPKLERLEAARKELAALEGAAAGAKKAEEASMAAREAESGEWLKKLRPFVASKSSMGDAPYYDPEKEMLSYAGFDIGAEELAKRHRIHAEAAEALQEYKNAGVKEPLELLADTAAEIESRLGKFYAALDGLGRIALKEARQQLDHGREFMDKNLVLAERGEEFLILSRDVLVGIQSRLDQAAVFLEKDDQELAGARADYAALDGDAAVLREKWAEKIRMLPEKYSGDDAGEIRSAAEAAIAAESPGAEVLRMNIVSPGWREDWRIQEGSDRVARFVAERHVNVQAAVRRGDGVFLLTLGVYSISNKDWSWGPVKAYVIFTDRMLEENVHK